MESEICQRLQAFGPSKATTAPLGRASTTTFDVAQIKDLPGCLTQGETLEETVSNINESRELWSETAYEAGDKIPLPSTTDYSGKLLLRMPKSLHRCLAEAADTENVSLNQYIVSLLSRVS